MNSDDIKFCPRCATVVNREIKFGKLRAVCPSCGWIHFADPKVAAGVLIEDQNKVLLVQRAYDPFKWLWTFPAGFVNADEDPALAAIRECEEETGLNIKLLGILNIRFGKEHPRGADFVIIYRAEVIGGILKAADDALAAEWFVRADLPPLAFEATKYTLENF
jgi:ADP-ribose pyrophosphatase YjhB (NUDIX family)